MRHPPRETLTELANSHGSDKGDRVRDRHGYTRLYDLLFGPQRDAPIAFLEIGLAVGGPETADGRVERRVASPSVAMWLDYFPQARIYGFDISDFSHIHHERFTFVRGDAGSADDLQRLAAAAPMLDVIIDDGSHASYHQQHCLKHLWPRLKPGGLYIVEDLHWQSPVFEASLPRVPLTAELFGSGFERGIFVDTPVFSRDELARLREETSACSVFRDLAGRVNTPKMLVLRKRPDLGAGAAAAQAGSLPVPATAVQEGEGAPRRVRSFDLFDTLIARRCIHPRAVFAQLEQRLGLPGFAEHRVAAEASVAAEDYSLHDIYRALAHRLPEAAGRLEEAEGLEIELELENLFPIAEHVAEVSPGDIVVSDMYLPQEVINALVHSVAGLRDVSVFVSPHGKRRGTVWATLQDRFRIAEHLGDNPDTDIRSPAAFGIPARQTAVSVPTRLEEEVGALGFPRLAEGMREARLRGWQHDPVERELQVLQANVNTPMLLAASVLVLRAARQAGVSQILASGRDCYLWLHLLRFLQDEIAPGVRTEYFYTGRVPRSFPSASYAAYVRRLAGTERCFVLDVCGTGWSLQRLCEQLGLPNAQPLLIQKMKDRALRGRYEGWAPTTGTTPVLALLDPDRSYDNELVELANPAPHPTVLDVTWQDGKDVPVFGDMAASPRATRLRAVLDEAFLLSTAPLLSRAILDEVTAAPSARLAEVLGHLYGAYGQFGGALRQLAAEHRAEDAAICALLEHKGRSWMPAAA
ncbi:class I SAM-dependent methyltransferase [Muricoccus nepalensis]|nr:class I SAM-dependent methyltransferase [Roseomonas nepalensis]